MLYSLRHALPCPAPQEACAAVVRAVQSNPRVLQLDLRMCGASWQDQVTLERAVAANNAALHRPLPLRDMLKVCSCSPLAPRCSPLAPRQQAAGGHVVGRGG